MNIKKWLMNMLLKVVLKNRNKVQEVQGNDAILRDLEERRDLPGEGSLNA